jgi:hypothetical protein
MAAGVDDRDNLNRIAYAEDDPIRELADRRSADVLCHEGK